MEQSNLMSVVTRPLSPDAKIEVPATWSEYEYTQEYLDTEGSKFPRLWYDGSCQHATVVAAPSPLHSHEVMRRGGIIENIQEGLTVSSSTTNCADAEDGLTIREWDGAISYVVDDERTIMVAFEVGVSQTYKNLPASHLMGNRGERPKVQYYASEQEARAAIQRARDEIRRQLRHNLLGPLVWNGVMLFGKLQKVVIETFRNEDPDCPPETSLEPSRSFVIVRDGRFSEQDVPPNLNDIVLGDCVPSHILSGSEIFFSTELV
ncbi:hypothetical protein V1524DRAFT_467598 [Lipomyces starkeyi]